MTIGGTGDSRASKDQRRDAARLKAKALREQQKKKDRRNRVFLQGGLVVAAVAIVAIVSLVIVNNIRPEGPGPKNMASDGVLIGQGMAVTETVALEPDATPIPSEPDKTGAVADIRIYLDYLCPYCGDFESTNSAQIAKWVESGAATVEIHPLSILTSKSAGTQYSLRAANAAACVANYSPTDFYAFNSGMFENQPSEGSTGLSDKEIKKVIKESGVSTSLSSIDTCVDELTFKSWVQNATSRALTGPIPNSTLAAVSTTPTVLVNGKQYVGSLDDPKEFASFVLQAAGETYSTSTPTPTPVPAG
ncbi:DsbA family protein [Leifsonia sp. A12D58]|uniref:DsbA family protein n=1 Tax=Leifsonia sp. A12D58 TaxID=3397674 RepID=UPI0039DF9BEB